MKKCKRKKNDTEERKSSPLGTLYVPVLNGFLLKTFIIMSLLKQIIGKRGVYKRVVEGEDVGDESRRAHRNRDAFIFSIFFLPFSN